MRYKDIGQIGHLTLVKNYMLCGVLGHFCSFNFYLKINNRLKLMIKIEESETNRFYRLSALLISYVFIIIGLASILFQILLYLMGAFQYVFPFIMVCLLFVFGGLYLRKRIAMVLAIGEDAIELCVSKNRILLSRDKIVSIAKMVRFSLSERMWLVISFINRKGKNERWLFQIEPNTDMINKLKTMNIKMKNFP